MNFLGVDAHCSFDASSISHPSIACIHHRDHLSWLAMCAECLPVAILSQIIWIKTSLLYDIFGASYFMMPLGINVHALQNAPSILHSSIACTGHQNDLAWSALSTEGLPVAILSDQSWIINFLLKSLLHNCCLLISWFRNCRSSRCIFHIPACISGFGPLQNIKHKQHLLPCLSYTLIDLQLYLPTQHVYKKTILLYDVFRTSYFVRLFGVHIQTLQDAPSHIFILP